MTDWIRVGAVAWLGRCVIGLIGRTLRWDVAGWEKLEAVHGAGKRWILAFWHGRLFLASWYFRGRGIAVMTSRNRDGEYIAHVIRRLGYRPARGSSSAGGHGAAREMLRILRQGDPIAALADLTGRIPLLVAGGRCAHGRRDRHRPGAQRDRRRRPG